MRSAQKLKFTKSHVGVIESRDMQFPTSSPSNRDINTNRLHKKYTIVLNKTVLNSEGKKWDEISQWFKIKVNINIMAVILHVPSAWGSLGFVSRYVVHACTSPKGILKISSHLEEFPPTEIGNQWIISNLSVNINLVYRKKLFRRLRYYRERPPCLLADVQKPCDFL